MSTRRQTRAKGMRTMADIARNAKSEKDKKEELSPVKEAPRSGRATPRPGGAGGKRQLEYLDLESAVVRYLLLPIAVPCCRGVDGCIGLSCAQFGLAFGALCSERDQCLG